MKQVLQHVRSGQLEVADVPEPYCKAGGVVVRNSASLISAGTERMVMDFAGKSLLGKAKQRPDLVKQVLDKVKKDGLGPTVETVFSRLDQPIPLGYSCAGVVEVVGRGAEEFSVGDRVACAGMGYASHADAVFVPKNLVVPVPEGVSFDDAAYVTLGAIALQGVRIADVRVGDNVAVIGLGLLGQLSVQLLKAAGCRVLGIDLDPTKVELALNLGADSAVLRSGDVEATLASFTGGAGVDAVVIAAATESNDPTELAGELCRDRGTVTVVGAVKMDVPRKVYYEKELDLRLSRSYGPGRYDPVYEEKGQDYPIGYVRWTERRNMQEFLRLVQTGLVTPARLTTHHFAIAEAKAAYALITAEQEPFLGVVLRYPTENEEQVSSARTIQLRTPLARKGRIGIGFIGAGNFARAVLLPRFARAADVDLVGLATATGMNAATTGKKYEFGYSTTDLEQLLNDTRVDAVVIATRHGSHAGFAARALRAGKAVLLEKPLAIDEAGLAEVIAARAEYPHLLAVGFNRRFSPLSVSLKSHFTAGQPLAVTYRINAGAVPPDSWLHDPEEGGGRIIGEVCHFVDLIQFLTGDEPAEVIASAVGGTAGALNDTFIATLKMRGGSIASINYFANGDRSFPKERVEVFGGGTVCVLDDFRSLVCSSGGKRTRVRRFSQEKGFDQEVAAFVASVRGDAAAAIPFSSLLATTRTTFAIEESLRTGAPVRVAPS